jgi:nitrate reductase NapAB chaperone NapD
MVLFDNRSARGAGHYTNMLVQSFQSTAEMHGVHAVQIVHRHRDTANRRKAFMYMTECATLGGIILL